MIEKRWIHKPELTPDQQLTSNGLAVALNINSRLATLLVQRGIEDFEESRNFFRPDISHLHDPYLMMDMEVAVHRLASAMQAGEKNAPFGACSRQGAALAYKPTAANCAGRAM